jgi:16S rRNA (adenine1518-N6/adenine1519-N6)-dimethyltransferase
VVSAQTLHEIRSLLESHGLAPKKSLGQNFLIDRNLVAKLVDEAGVGEGDLVLEVGPGTGTLTGELLARGCEVVACELDDGLARLLADRFADQARFTLVHGDCLASKRALSPELARALGDRPFRLVANLPYQAATPLMLHLLIARPACGGLFVTIQREVADRLLAEPGSKEYGAISVVARCTARVRRIANLPCECFWPRPKVVSTMVGLERLDPPRTADAAALAEFCQRVFAGRRKQLGGLLRSLDLTPEVWPENIALTDRIEALPPDRIESLARACPRR